MVLTQILNGLSEAMMLFIIASGLTLIFGLMGVVNFAHGAFYAVGGYVAVYMLGFTDSFWLLLVAAPLAAAALGMVVEYVLVRPLYSRDAIYQVLLTFGLAITLEELIVITYDSDPKNLPGPEIFNGAISFAGVTYPRYRLFVILTGLVVGAALWLFMRETRFGIIIRAGTFDSEMVGALGIDIRRVFTIMFGIGIFLAAVGGVLAGPMIGVYSTMGTDVIIDAFIIVVIGGLGSVRGSFVGALLIGFSRSFGAFYADQLVPIILFTLMIAVLLVRPHGLFGQQGIFEH